MPPFKKIVSFTVPTNVIAVMGRSGSRRDLNGDFAPQKSSSNYRPSHCIRLTAEGFLKYS
ncbi:MAG: hypothetical protein MRQ11_03230 [Candidatus Midichloria mitochondrii]|uniref:Uncharacterized protein n=1 Tax=Midichloria mitochondrii (strain IricVA) TaxID=696127 RepID=F7XTS1_MIDMI|nr:hypothetical protein [Candidatus Midichloria mitochondrii]AEI89280.1 hypothetical protein midi_01000 [Candidatus Midichloria mitochondrii IricVA]MDJ1256423.1 hypothetical protein [Candidatus Midichloria mitochondrii]MDJ1298976.1 hypothetical protein [Candidatus Midichloria mitochondrii]MDJ1583691.1 hypothetical protein [Candidatus Midichloria mitochondrii]